MEPDVPSRGTGACGSADSSTEADALVVAFWLSAT